MKRIHQTWITKRAATLARVGALIVLQGRTAMSRPRAVPDDPAYAPARAQAMLQRDPESRAIFQVSRNYNIYGDTKAVNVGDVLTVFLEESTSASKNAETSISKDQELSIPEPNLFGKNNIGLNASANYERDFEGSAEADQS